MSKEPSKFTLLPLEQVSAGEVMASSRALEQEKLPDIPNS